MAQEVRYEGDVITDITSFSMVQNIFDGKKEVTRSQIETLDSIIQLLVFYDTIWVVKPALFGKEVAIESQEILNTLIRDGVIHQLPELPSDFAGDPETQFREIQEIIAQQLDRGVLRLPRRHRRGPPHLQRELRCLEKPESHGVRGAGFA